MKSKVMLVTAAVLATALCSPGWSTGGYAPSGVSNRGIQSRRAGVGLGTVPPSSIQSGLVRSPNPIEAGGSPGNLIITGNVQGGKHFRGPVPYGAESDFRASLGSASLDSFLRYSGDSQYGDDSLATYQPFYSPTGTVATIRPGQSTVLMPAGTRIADRAELALTGLPGSELALQDIPAGSVLGPPTAEYGRVDFGNPRLSRDGDFFGPLVVRSRPMLRTPQELEKLISDDLDKVGDLRSPRSVLQDQPPSYEPGESATSQSSQYRAQMEQLERQLKRLADEAAELRQSLSTELATGRQPSPEVSALEQPGRLSVQQSEPVFEQADQDAQADALGQLNERLSLAEARTKLDKLLASASQQRPKQSPPEMSQSTVPFDKIPSASLGTGRVGPFDKLRAGSAEELPGTGTLIRQKDGGRARDQQLMTRGTSDGQGETTKLAPATTYDIRYTSEERRAMSLTPLQEVNKLSRGQLAAEAERILGGHQDYNSFSKGKFSQYFQAGQQYLGQGKYYRAVDAYTLAAIYKPGELELGLAYAGKSLALFAAGEYMSSALFLSRAIAVLSAAGGSILNCQFSLPKDEVDKRVADAEECLRVCRDARNQTGSMGDLQFLLGYIYLRTGRLSEAKSAISEAYKMLPDSQAVKVLKEAINQPASRQ